MSLHVGDERLGGTLQGLDLRWFQLARCAVDAELPAGLLPQVPERLGPRDRGTQRLFEGGLRSAVGEIPHQAAGVGEVLAGGVLDAAELDAGRRVGVAGAAAEHDDRVQPLGEGVVDVLGEALTLLGDALAPLGIGQLGLGGPQLDDEFPVAVRLLQQPTVDGMGDQ